MPLPISVVIPAHDPGPYIEPCIRSLLRQTMSRQRFEVIFVDDGSTDGTGARLDRLAREQPHVRVIHIPASGAPGRPRNVGLGAALGEYIQFLDADDELAPRALERLYRMARANDSDIVVAKFASETMTRRQDLFNRNRGATTLAGTPQLIEASLGPTKLFRAAFLREHGIEFPEGWRQMEDQLFTLRAYLEAEVISILGDEPCYFFNKREDEGHISSELVDPATHVAHLNEVLDEVERRVADPVLRDRIETRFYRLEVLNRVARQTFLDAPARYRQSIYAALNGLAKQRLSRDVHRGLGAVARIRSRLLLNGSLADHVAFEQRVSSFAVDARIGRAAWTRGRLAIEFTAVLLRGERHGPVTVVERDGRTFLDPSVVDDLVGPVDVSHELAGIRAQVSLIDRGTRLEWIVPGASVLSFQPVGDVADAPGDARVLELAGFVEIDPQRVGPGDRMLDDGAWDLQVRWLGLGLPAVGQLRLPTGTSGSQTPSIAPALLGRPVRWAVPYVAQDGSLRLGVGSPDRTPAQIDEHAANLLREGRRISIALPVATSGSGPIARGVVRLAADDLVVEVPATFAASMGGVVVSVADLGASGPVPPGRYVLTAHVGGGDAPGLGIGAGHVRDDGRIVIVGLGRESWIGRLWSWFVWTTRIAAQDARMTLLAAFRRLPQPARGYIRMAYGRLRR